MKYLGIDFGEKKVGFSQSDGEGKLAFPLMISDNDKTLLKDTLTVIRELKIGIVVIGESVDSKGKPNPIAKEARKFAASIENAVDVRIVFEKEWYSTKEARTQPGKEGSHDVDDAAAAIILQRYLDRGTGGAKTEEVIVEADDEEKVENW